MPKRPFELDPHELAEKLEEMVEITVSDLQSEFLLMPIGPAYINYEDFRDYLRGLSRNSLGVQRYDILLISISLSDFSS